MWLQMLLFHCFMDEWFSVVFFVVVLFASSRAAPEAYGGSQARDRIRAAAAVLHHSHSNARSEPHR